MRRPRPSRIEPTVPWPPRPTGNPQIDAARMALWRAEKQRIEIEQESEQQEERWEKRRWMLSLVVLVALCACGMWLMWLLGRETSAEEQRLATIERRLEELEDACLPMGGWL